MADSPPNHTRRKPAILLGSWLCGLLLGGLAGAFYLRATSVSNPQYLAADGMDKGFALIGCVLFGALWGALLGFCVGLVINHYLDSR